MAKNYRAVPLFAAFLVWPVIIGIPIAAVILLFGLGAFIKFWQFMNQPIVAGSIPIWAIFAVGISILIIMKRRQTNPYFV